MAPFVEVQTSAPCAPKFELPITHMAGARKLSQNKAPDDRARLTAGLRASGDAASVQVAALVQETLCSPCEPEP